MKNRPRVPDLTLRWDQVICNLERGYIYTKDNYPNKMFLLFILAMEEESKRTPFLSRYKGHPVGDSKTDREWIPIEVNPIEETSMMMCGESLSSETSI